MHRSICTIRRISAKSTTFIKGLLVMIIPLPHTHIYTCLQRLFWDYSIPKFPIWKKSIFFCNKLNLVINTHLKFANIMGNLAIRFALLSCWPALRNHIIFLKIIRMIRQEKLRNHKSLNYSIASVSWLNICKIKCMSQALISSTIHNLAI